MCIYLSIYLFRLYIFTYVYVCLYILFVQFASYLANSRMT